MTPIHIISRDLSTAQQMQKMNRDEYAKWKRHEEAAKERARRLKG